MGISLALTEKSTYCGPKSIMPVNWCLLLAYPAVIEGLAAIVGR